MEPRFRVLGVPVQVSLVFFLTVFLIRPRRPDDTPALVAAWMAIAFLGVLLHELGHALAGRSLGLQPHIRLVALGGVTSWREGAALSPGRRILISLAGPGVGIALGVASWVLGVAAGVSRRGGAADRVLDYFVWVNFGWGLLNLLPLLPLDGGNVMAALFEWVGGFRGRRAARVISMVLALGLAALCLAAGAFIAAALCALFVFANYQGLRTEGRARPVVTASSSLLPPEGGGD